MKSDQELMQEVIDEIRKDADYLVGREGMTPKILTENVIKTAGAAAWKQQFTASVAKDLMSKMLAALTLVKKSQEPM